MGVRSFVKNACILGLAAGGSQAIRIIQSNDDGWAEMNIRVFHDALIQADHDAVVSAPAENMSGQGSSDEDPAPRTDACEYDSCPANTNLAYSSNATSPRLNWVNSYPATSMRYGLDTITPALWANAPAELAVTGPNVGSNLAVQGPFSGTVGAACYAVEQAGIPAIAFSGLSDQDVGLQGGNAAWNTTPVPTNSLVFADLALNLTSRLIASGAPYLPNGTYLNVNFAAVTATSCTSASAYQWVYTRVYPDLLADDIELCGSDTLPQETTVVHSDDGCYVSVSAASCSDKGTASKEVQQAVYDKIGDMFVCKP